MKRVLNDQCFERLHSLFDRGRSVYDPQLWKVKANPDCLFLWTRNSYDRLSNPILSRWRILQINYPPVLNEAFKISKYSQTLIKEYENLKKNIKAFICYKMSQEDNLWMSIEYVKKDVDERFISRYNNSKHITERFQVDSNTENDVLSDGLDGYDLFEHRNKPEH
mgnify:CR=1 FL=1